MNDYGFRPSGLLGIVPTKGYFPKPTDVYDPTKPNNGNTNFGNPEHYELLEWISNRHATVDLRLFYTTLGPQYFNKCRWTEGDAEQGPKFYRISLDTGT